MLRFFILFFSISCFSQKTVKVYYDYEIKNGPLVKKTGVTLVEGSTSFYYEYLEKEDSQNGGTELFETGGKISYFTQPSDVNSNKRYQLYTLSKDTLFSLTYIKKETFLIAEKKHEFNWTITSETQTILGKYNCVKAETYFRGRKFIAWFTTDIPIKQGPWKFSGLPGLILLVQDSTGQYVWSVAKIETTETKAEIPDLSGIKKIPLKDYISMRDNIISKQSEEDSKIMEIRMAQLGIKATTTNRATKSRTLELIYEWEN